jgi:hypothetical protein
MTAHIASFGVDVWQDSEGNFYMNTDPSDPVLTLTITCTSDVGEVAPGTEIWLSDNAAAYKRELLGRSQSVVPPLANWCARRSRRGLARVHPTDRGRAVQPGRARADVHRRSNPQTGPQDSPRPSADQPLLPCGRGVR